VACPGDPADLDQLRGQIDRLRTENAELRVKQNALLDTIEKSLDGTDLSEGLKTFLKREKDAVSVPAARTARQLQASPEPKVGPLDGHRWWWSRRRVNPRRRALPLPRRCHRAPPPPPASCWCSSTPAAASLWRSMIRGGSASQVRPTGISKHRCSRCHLSQSGHVWTWSRVLTLVTQGMPTRRWPSGPWRWSRSRVRPCCSRRWPTADTCGSCPQATNPPGSTSLMAVRRDSHRERLSKAVAL
jgi:hypothetical protein